LPGGVLRRRGRQKGVKDSKPRVRRTNAELIAAGVKSPQELNEKQQRRKMQKQLKKADLPIETDLPQTGMKLIPARWSDRLKQILTMEPSAVIEFPDTEYSNIKTKVARLNVTYEEHRKWVCKKERGATKFTVTRTL
jgi:hypothetical protein